MRIVGALSVGKVGPRSRCGGWLTALAGRSRLGRWSGFASVGGGSRASGCGAGRASERERARGGGHIATERCKRTGRQRSVAGTRSASSGVLGMAGRGRTSGSGRGSLDRTRGEQGLIERAFRSLKEESAWRRFFRAWWRRGGGSGGWSSWCSERRSRQGLWLCPPWEYRASEFQRVTRPGRSASRSRSAS
jgi:hypothetical protein